MRAGLFAGIGSAVTVLIFGLLFVPFCGPLVAIIGGATAGMQVVRDPRYLRAPGTSGAIAGAWASVVVGVAQIAGGLLGMVTPYGQESIRQVTQMNPQYTPSLIWFGMVALSLFFALVDAGVIIGCGALAATWAAKRINQRQPGASAPAWRGPSERYATERETSAPDAPPPAPARPAYVPPPIVQTPRAPQRELPPPPTTYPPPPSYYGLPDTADGPPTPPAE